MLKSFQLEPLFQSRGQKEVTVNLEQYEVHLKKGRTLHHHFSKWRTFKNMLRNKNLRNFETDQKTWVGFLKIDLGEIKVLDSEIL